MPKPTFYEGQTATNHETGERLVYRGGKWFPYGGDATANPIATGTSKDQEALQTLRDTAHTNLNTAIQAERFVGMNRKTATGPGTNLPVIPLIPKFMGESPTWGGVGNALNPDWQAMQSISAAVAPGLRPPGSGSSSDKDTALYMQAFPNTKNLGTANAQIAQRLQDQSDMAAARSAFADTWFAKRGNLLGADEAFNRFWAQRSAKAKPPPAPPPPKLPQRSDSKSGWSATRER